MIYVFIRIEDEVADATFYRRLCQVPSRLSHPQGLLFFFLLR